jgi:hypothetical protein
MKKYLRIFSIIIIVLQTNLFSQSSFVQQIIDSVNIDSLIYFVKELSGEVPTIVNDTSQTILSRHSYQPGNALAEVYLRQKLESYGLQTITQSFNSSGNNVLATQVGSIFPNRKFIICAHYDDMPAGPIAPGADDNASGTAAVIEAARIFSQYSFPFTIIYALWDMEEQGLHGSIHYATLAANSGDSIICVINMDMIAYDTNNDDVCSIHNRDVGTSIMLYNKMVQVNTNYGIGLNIVSYNPGLTNSDHAPFWYFGYGAIFLCEDPYNFNQYYHTTSDLIQYFNQSYFHKNSRLALGTLADLQLNYFYGNIFPDQAYVNKYYARPNIDTVKFRTQFTNFYNHPFNARLMYRNSGNLVIDSMLLFDDGFHWDSLANDGIYGCYIPPMQIEDIYSLSVNLVDLQTNEQISSPSVCSFTTAGPVKLDSIQIIKGITNYYNIRPFVRNEGNAFSINNSKIKLMSNDPWVSGVAGAVNLPTITPGAVVGASSWIAVGYHDSIFPGHFNLIAEISVDEVTYWTDSMQVIVTGIDGEETLPIEYALLQNYPNPFNPNTTISWQSPVGSHQTIKVFDVLGNEVATLVDEYKLAGRYEVEFNAEKLASGIYFYKLQAGDYTAVKKMILIK